MAKICATCNLGSLTVTGIVRHRWLTGSVMPLSLRLASGLALRSGQTVRSARRASNLRVAASWDVFEPSGRTMFMSSDHSRTCVLLPEGLFPTSWEEDGSGSLHIELNKELSVDEFISLTRENEGCKFDHCRPNLIVVDLYRYPSRHICSGVCFQLEAWNQEELNGRGMVLLQRAGFAMSTLPQKEDGSAVFKMPDISFWVDGEEYKSGPFASPDVVKCGSGDVMIEVARPYGDLTADGFQVNERLIEKMELYGKNGCKLGLIFNVDNQEVWEFHFASPSYCGPKAIRFPTTGDITGKDVLPGFKVDFEKLRRFGWLK